MTRAARERRREWDDLARVDPFWGVITVPEQRGGGDRDAFFASGERLVSQMLEIAEELGRPAERSRAVDFGCGLGRLTRALASRFRTVDGIDVSGELVRQAIGLHGDLANCRFTQLTDGELAAIDDGSADFMCAMLVLQHQGRPEAVRSYIGHFIRIINDGGVAVFQLPSEIPWRNRVQPRRRLYSLLRRAGVPPRMLYGRLGLDPIRMLHLSPPDVAATIERAGGVLLRTVDDDLAGRFPSATYYVARRGSVEAREERSSPAPPSE